MPARVAASSAIIVNSVQRLRHIEIVFVRAATRMCGRYNRRMQQEEVAKLMLDVERSLQLRQVLLDKLARKDKVDLVEEWNSIEQLDLEIARKIRKRPIE